MFTGFNVHEIWNIFFIVFTISDLLEFGLLNSTLKISFILLQIDILISEVFNES